MLIKDDPTHKCNIHSKTVVVLFGPKLTFLFGMEYKINLVLVYCVNDTKMRTEQLYIA